MEKERKKKKDQILWSSLLLYKKAKRFHTPNCLTLTYRSLTYNQKLNHETNQYDDLPCQNTLSHVIFAKAMFPDRVFDLTKESDQIFIHKEQVIYKFKKKKMLFNPDVFLQNLL